MHKKTAPTWKHSVPHEESLQKISKMLPRTDTWFELGNSIDLTLRADNEFYLEDNVVTTMALDARIVPHTVQLPIIKKHKKKGRKVRQGEQA